MRHAPSTTPRRGFRLCHWCSHLNHVRRNSCAVCNRPKPTPPPKSTPATKPSSRITKRPRHSRPGNHNSTAAAAAKSTERRVESMPPLSPLGGGEVDSGVGSVVTEGSTPCVESMVEKGDVGLGEGEGGSANGLSLQCEAWSVVALSDVTQDMAGDAGLVMCDESREEGWGGGGYVDLFEEQEDGVGYGGAEGNSGRVGDVGSFPLCIMDDLLGGESI
eukprot:GFKZ01002509.1.p1 GENE.GFKZ01002509.1~~GFKZ01002509.1.p1  ORF type:complete len:251 (-),score=39.13 GFKZ01002509.1:62-715(-)